MSGNLRHMDLGKVGIWSGVLRRGDPGEAAEAAAELESLGFGALWIPGGAGGDVLGDSLRLMDATTRVVVATGILNIWMHEAADVAAGHAALTEQHPGRFLLGLGVSHAPAVERSQPELHAALRQDGRLPRPARRGLARRAARRDGARRARAEDAPPVR